MGIVSALFDVLKAKGIMNIFIDYTKLPLMELNYLNNY